MRLSRRSLIASGLAAAPAAAAADSASPRIASRVCARLVPRRQVRDLGALGAAMRARVRRLVRAADVPAGPPAVAAGRDAVRASPAALRPSEPHRLHRHHRPVESRALGAGDADPRAMRRRARATSSRWAAITTISTISRAATMAGTRRGSGRSATSSAHGNRSFAHAGLKFGDFQSFEPRLALVAAGLWL